MPNSVEVIFGANYQADKAFAQLLADVKRTADGVEKMGTKGTQALDKLDKKAASTSKSFGRSISVMAGKFLILEMAIGRVGRMLDTLVFDFNSKMETAGLGIASALMSNGQYIDNLTGKALEGQQALNAAQYEAKQLVEELQVANFKTIATLDQIIRAFQETLPVAMATGFDVSKTKEFTVAMVQAAGAIGLSLDMLGEETRSMLTGGINPKNTRIATALGLRNEDIAQFKGNADELFNFLMEKLTAYREAGKVSQETWAGTWSNAVDIFRQMSAKISEPLFENIKADLKGITDDLVSVDDLTGKIEWNQDFLDQVEQLQGGIGAIYVLLKGASGLLADFGGEVGTRWLNAIELTSKLVEKLQQNEKMGLMLDAFIPALADQFFGAGGGLFNDMIEVALNDLNNNGEIRLPMPERKSASTYHQRTNGTDGDDSSGGSTNSKINYFVPAEDDQWLIRVRKEIEATNEALKVLQEYNREKLEKLQADNREKYVLDIAAGNAMSDDPWMSRAFEEGLESATERMWEMKEASDTWQLSLMDGLDELANYYDETFTDRITGSVHSAFDSMEDTLVDFAMTGKASFKDMVNSILADLIRLNIQQSISAPLASALSGAIGSLFASANGNVFSNGTIIPFANGTIVTKPTYFPMAGGDTGLMGEAGEEAIMPLTRINGKLGVLAQGGNQQPNITLYQHLDLRGSDESAVPRIAEQADKIANLAVRKVAQQMSRGGELYNLSRG